MSKMEKALAVLAAGGEFAVKLENGWHGEKWCYRLKAAGGSVVKGVGFATFHALKPKLVKTGAGTSVSSYYKLAV